MAPTAFKQREHRYECGDFPETTAYQRYGVRTSEKANVRSIAHAPSPAGYAGVHASCQEHVHTPCGCDAWVQAFVLSVSSLSLLISVLFVPNG